MRLGAVHRAQHLVVADGAAGASLRDIRLVNLDDASAKLLRDAVFIRGLQAAEHGAVSLRPGFRRRQDGRDGELAGRIEAAVHVRERRAVAELFAQLRLALLVGHLCVFAELTGGVDRQILARGDFETVLCRAVSLREIRDFPLRVDIPVEAGARVRRGEWRELRCAFRRA